jgi:hypothetical protein
MTTDLEFTVAKRRAEPITFTLGVEPGQKATEQSDHIYSFTPPKSAVMMMPVIDNEDTGDLAMTRATFNWLEVGLSTEDSERILARLRDPADDLDVDTLAKVISGLSERASARPST